MMFIGMALAQHADKNPVIACLCAIGIIICIGVEVGLWLTRIISLSDAKAEIAAALREARAEALREAAKVAEKISANYWNSYVQSNYKGPGEEGAQSCSAAASMIRALLKP